MNSLRIVFFVFSILAFSSSLAANAEDACPSATGAPGRYYIARNGNQTEVQYDATPEVRTILRMGSQTLLETTQHQGLLQLERIDRGRRIVYTPKSALPKDIPLKLGQKLEFVFDSKDDQRNFATTIKLEVVGSDRLSIGRCKYDIVKFAHGSGLIEYYAPELKMVIAKEYKERNGTSTIIKYDAISAKP